MHLATERRRLAALAALVRRRLQIERTKRNTLVLLLLASKLAHLSLGQLIDQVCSSSRFVSAFRCDDEHLHVQ